MLNKKVSDSSIVQMSHNNWQQYTTYWIQENSESMHLYIEISLLPSVIHSVDTLSMASSFIRYKDLSLSLSLSLCTKCKKRGPNELK